MYNIAFRKQTQEKIFIKDLLNQDKNLILEYLLNSIRDLTPMEEVEVGTDSLLKRFPLLIQIPL